MLGCEVFEVWHADVEFWWWCHIRCNYPSFSYNSFAIWRCRCWGGEVEDDSSCTLWDADPSFQAKGSAVLCEGYQLFVYTIVQCC